MGTHQWIRIREAFLYRLRYSGPWWPWVELDNEQGLTSGDTKVSFVFSDIKLPFFIEFSFAETKQGCDLKIQRIDKSASTVEGNKEIWMIAKKIDRTFFIYF